MQYHKEFGVAVPEVGWFPAPRYILRRYRLLKLFAGLSGRVLEVGCGPGALLLDLEKRGFQTTGLETSEQARGLAAIIHSNSGASIVAEPGEDWAGAFDAVAVFEVLEHIEADVAALKSWAHWLKPGGHLLLSVPAHQYFWNENDVWAGHIKRYSRRELAAAVEAAGLEPVHSEYYGFPLATITEQINGVIKKRRKRREAGMSEAERTARSGSDRRDILGLWPIISSVFGVLLFRFFGLLQRPQLTGALASGLIVMARKPERD